MVSVFVEFQSLVDSPGLSFFGGIICLQAWQTCCDTPHLFGKNITISSFSSCEVVTAGMHWAADKIVWVCLPSGRFPPGERSIVSVLTRPPKRKCSHLLWSAEFPNRRFYSSSCVGLTWAWFWWLRWLGARFVVMLSWMLLDYRIAAKMLNGFGSRFWWFRLGKTMGCCAPNAHGNAGSLESSSRSTISGSVDVTEENVGISFVRIPDNSVKFGIFGELFRCGFSSLGSCSTKNTTESIESIDTFEAIFKLL